MPDARHLKGFQDERTCCGVIERATFEAREKRAAKKKQPWVVLKLMIPVVLALIGYATYVYIGILCLRMIRRKPGAGASRGAGIALLIVYAILLLWMVWAYIKVILTPPGFARDHSPKTTQPTLPMEIYRPSGDASTEINHQSHHTHPSQSTTHHLDHPSETIGGPSYENILASATAPSKMYRYSIGEMHNGNGRRPVQEIELAEPETVDAESNAGVLDTIPRPVGSDGSAAMGPAPSNARSRQQTKREEDWARRRMEANVMRRPPTAPVLLSAHRYCYRDEVVKPFRAHHCRNCGTCVLKYDHHCPWIGQCVGARNHKFFVNFCQATSVFSAYTFSTLIAFNVRAAHSADGDIDPQEIIIIALAGLFGLFTTMLIIGHFRLIWVGQSTVESMQIRAMKEREEEALSKVFSWWEFSAKRRTRKEWDDEWGDLNKEGHIWWLGSGKAGWEDVMGTNKWGWILPIGRSKSDGLMYPPNPRFDEQGRWRRRPDWPEELR